MTWLRYHLQQVRDRQQRDWPSLGSEARVLGPAPREAQAPLVAPACLGRTLSARAAQQLGTDPGCAELAMTVSGNSAWTAPTRASRV